MTFRHQLKQERERRGWSQGRLAEEVGTTAITVSKWERGIATPSPYFRERLMTLFGQTAHELGLLNEESQEVSQEAVPLTAPAPRQSSKRLHLLTKVEKFWLQGMLVPSLHGSPPIQMRLELHPYAVKTPWSFLKQKSEMAPRPLPEGTSIANVYDEAGGELLILGEPGAGKTTLLLELTRELIARARADEQAPIPIVFHLSSWTKTRVSLADWFIEELQSKYQVPAELSRIWIQEDKILPLLDGLDEVVEESRLLCIETINAYRQKHGLIPFVLCSRQDDYLKLDERLLLQQAVVVQPLNQQQIDLYLEQQGEHANVVHEMLEHDKQLQQLAQTPLMLTLLSSLLSTHSVQELLAAETVERRRQSIIDHYVRHMLEMRASDNHWQLQEAHHWLSWLAEQLKQHGQSEFYLEHLQADWLPDTSSRQRYDKFANKLLSGFLSGLASSLASSLSILFIILVFRDYELAISWSMLAVGLFVGLFFGLFTMLLSPKFHSLLAFLVSGLCFGLFTGYLRGFPNGLSFGVATGLISTAIVTLRLVKTSENKISLREIVHWSWQRQRKHIVKSLYKGLLGGLLGWSIFTCVMGIIIAKIYANDVQIVPSAALSVLLVFLPLTSITTIWGISHGFSQDMLPDLHRRRVNQGFMHSARNGVLIGILYGLVAELFIGLFSGIVAIANHSPFLHDLLTGLWLGIPLALLAGLLAGLMNGGQACLQHLLLRMLLWRANCLPWNYSRFLNEMSRRVLLRKIGGGYIFAHQLLQNYFYLPSSDSQSTTARLPGK